MPGPSQPPLTALRLGLCIAVLAASLSGAVPSSPQTCIQPGSASAALMTSGLLSVGQTPALRRPPYAGWAMEAYPGVGRAQLEADMRRQVRAGANVVWLGHDNPGQVGYAKVEPGLAYAVWAAYRSGRGRLHREAVAMVQAQIRALQAARDVGVQVVLPIGYQIQMGDAWNAAHPRELRRSADGSLYNASGGRNRSASFFGPSYRRDIAAYYRWIDARFVRPFRNTILMLNLADEPQDGDYSAPANNAFRRQHGYGLMDAGKDGRRQEAVGRFQSAYIARYAGWSARQWLRLEPRLPVTMSFCGGYARYTHEGPDLEAIFRDTPRNFEVTFDAYPRDGLFDTRLRRADLASLFLLARTLGFYSRHYHRPLWLWSAANSWGLNEASTRPGHIADAVANGIYLAQLARQTGGNLRGMAVWNYNIRGQGLFHDTHHLSYSPDRMFARVSASFPLLRSIMRSPPGAPNIVLLAPNTPVLRRAGAERALRATDLYDWGGFDALARAGTPAVAVTHLDRSRPRAVVVLARSRSDVTASSLAILRATLSHGGVVVAASGVAAVLAWARPSRALVAQDATHRVRVFRVGTSRGRLLAVSGGRVEDIFRDASHRWAAWFLPGVLGRPVPVSGYRVSWAGLTLVYNPAKTRLVTTVAALPGTQGRLAAYSTQGSLRETAWFSARFGPVHLSLTGQSYALLH